MKALLRTRMRHDACGRLSVFLLGVLLLAGFVSTADAQSISISSLGTPIPQNFDSLAAAPDNNTTNSLTPVGWLFSESLANAGTTYRIGNGSSNAGDTYSLGTTASTERAFGTLQSGTLLTTIGGRFINNTGATIRSLRVAYTGEQWRWGATGRRDTLQFVYKVNQGGLTSGTYTDVNALDFAGPFSSATGTPGQLDGNNPAFRTSLDQTFCVTAAPGDTLWVRWIDSNANGADDGLGVDDFSLTAYGDITLSETHVNATCSDATDGSIDLSVSGGTGSYTYLWSPGGETTEDLSGLGAGTYSVTVSDGCASANLDVTITEPPALALAETHTNVSCYGAADGTIDLSVSGGTPAYSYLWSPGGETTEDLSGLGPGTYSVTVTDANNCTASLDVTITEPAELQLSETHVNVTCNGGSTGSIDLSVTGGTSPYSYLWSPGGETTEDLSGLAAGTYSVTVTDDNDCTANLDVTITESDGLLLTETHENVSCFGAADGSIDLTVSGGTPPYSYLWSPGGETTEDLSGLGPGTYSVTVTDDAGCTGTLDVTITEPDELTLSETHTDVACDGTGGSIDLTVAGGTPGYSYLWTPGGETTEDLSGLGPGTYCVDVTDANGCTANLCVDIEARPSYSIVATADPGGSISPSGTIIVPCGEDTTFAITADPGYYILDVLVDSVSVGPVPTYTFFNVTANHTIHATFDIVVATWLSVFSANPMPEGIELRWSLAEAGAFAEVLIERGLGTDGPWTRVTQPVRTEGSVSVVVDRDLTPGTTYHYQLTGVERDGRSVSLGRITGTAGDAIRQFTLAPAWPNPAQAGLVHVEFTIPKETSIHLSVLDIQGREVAVVATGSFPAGSYHVAWTGETDRGATAPSGVYFLVLQSTDGPSLKQRVVLAR